MASTAYVSVTGCNQEKTGKTYYVVICDVSAVQRIPNWLTECKKLIKQPRTAFKVPNSSKYVDQSLWHVSTGNLNVVSRGSLRGTMKIRLNIERGLFHTRNFQ